jgi:hypothetical protein
LGSTRRIARRVLPKSVRSALAPRPYSRRISPETLALRTYLITRMHAQMSADGRSAD